MALAIAAVAGLLLVSFGLGVTVGLLQPAGDAGPVGQEQVPLAVAESQLDQAPAGSAREGQPQGVATPPEEAVEGLVPRLTPAGEPPEEARTVPPPAPTPATAAAPPLPQTPTPTLTPAVTPAVAPTPTPTLAQTPTQGLPRSQTPTVAPTAPSPAPAATGFPPSPSPRPTAPVVAAGSLWVQVGSLSQAQQGEGLRLRVLAMGFAPEQVVVVRAADGRYRVRLGPFPDEESAGRVLARIRPQGFPDAFLVRE